MVKDIIAKQPLTEDQRKENANKNLQKEVSEMKSINAKWSATQTIFDKLPANERPFSIEPFQNERQRIPFKMTEEDRLRRKAYMHAQELTDREPINVPELERMIYNPIRRLYRAPTDKLFNAITPVVGEAKVRGFRVLVPKLAMLYMSGVFLWYQFKYNKMTWEQQGGFNMVKSQAVVLPGDIVPEAMKKQDYADYGFQSRKIYKDEKYAY